MVTGVAVAWLNMASWPTPLGAGPLHFEGSLQEPFTALIQAAGPVKVEIRSISVKLELY
jgi:hypothetical protein